MKANQFSILLISIILSQISIYGQVIYPEKQDYQEYSHSLEIKPEGEMKAIFDSVYPGVRFLSRGYTNSRYSEISLILDTDTMGYANMPRVQLDLAFLNDSVMRYSEIAVIKSFIFLDLIREQGVLYQGGNISSTDIVIEQTYIDLRNNTSPKYRYLDSTERFINYSAVVKLDPGLTIMRTPFVKNTINVIYEFQVEDGLIKGFLKSFIDNQGNKTDVIYMNISRESMIRTKHDYKRTREEKKKSSSSINSWEHVYFSGPSTLERNSIPNGVDSYHHITIEENGVFADGGTKFWITGIDVVNHPHPEFRIYSAEGFGNTRTLLFSSALEGNTNASRETLLEYSPENNDIDGFCVFEIWDGDLLVTRYANDFLVLQRKRNEVSLGKTLNIFFAKNFFYNHEYGNSVSNAFIDKLVVFYNETWQKQVIDFDLNNGSPPSTTDNTYELSVNPFQETTSYVFQHNAKLSDCFETQRIKRGIGITANPKQFAKLLDSRLKYTEDEFLKIVLAHEFYHGLQYTFNNLFSTNFKNKTWLMEGQARAIQSIQYPEIEYKLNDYGDYVIDANNYIKNFLNVSWINQTGPDGYGYSYDLFWRFLYENYNPTGTIKEKLAIFRETCIGFSATTVPELEAFMNSKLNSTAYSAMDDAIIDFSKRVLFNDPGTDPNNSLWNPGPDESFYALPEYRTLVFDTKKVSDPDAIASSFGMDFKLIKFKNRGKALINFNGNPDGGHSPEFALNLVYKDDPTHKNNFIPAVPGSGLASKEIEVTSADTYAYLIITRIDSDESLAGKYILNIEPSTPEGVLKSDFDKSKDKSASNSISINTSVDFIDISHAGNYAISDWKWDFPGGQPSSSEMQNPTGIEYTTYGVYPVSLTVTDESGAQDTKTINDYITVYEPEGGSSGSLSISGSNPSFGFPGQYLSINLNILTGTPPFKVKINYGDGDAYEIDECYDLFYNQFHSYSASNTYQVLYSVTDALGNIGTDSWSISIGMPGTQHANFTFSWSNPGNPAILGTNMAVQLIDETSGGYQPYQQWQWILGKGINTGIQPKFSNNFPWFTVFGLMSGNPTETVSFTAFDTYPITLIVYDNSGFQTEKTKLILVSSVEKCMALRPNAMEPYNPKIKKHVIKYTSNDSYINSNDDFFNYFDFWNPVQYCYNQYPGDPNNGGKTNVITNSRWKIKKNEILKKEQSDAMPNNWTSGSYYCDDYYNWAGWWDGCSIFTPNEISYKFQEKGKYIVQLEGWNRYVHTNQNQVYPDNDQNLSMYSVIQNTFYVVDCDEHQYININYSGTNYEDQLAGYFNFANSLPVTIFNGAKAAFEACTEIIFNQGFTSENGSDFRASAVEISDSDKSRKKMKVVSENLDNFTIGLSIQPNPNTGLFVLRSNDSRVKLKEVVVLNYLSQIVNAKISCAANYATIQITDPVPGAYILLIKDSTEQVRSMKFIVTSL
jgi:hypothetical protein